MTGCWPTSIAIPPVDYGPNGRPVCELRRARERLWEGVGYGDSDETTGEGARRRTWGDRRAHERVVRGSAESALRRVAGAVLERAARPLLPHGVGRLGAAPAAARTADRRARERH